MELLAKEQAENEQAEEEQAEEEQAEKEQAEEEQVEEKLAEEQAGEEQAEEMQSEVEVGSNYTKEFFFFFSTPKTLYSSFYHFSFKKKVYNYCLFLSMISLKNINQMKKK